MCTRWSVGVGAEQSVFGNASVRMYIQRCSLTVFSLHSSQLHMCQYDGAMGSHVRSTVHDLLVSLAAARSALCLRRWLQGALRGNLIECRCTCTSPTQGRTNVRSARMLSPSVKDCLFDAAPPPPDSSSSSLSGGVEEEEAPSYGEGAGQADVGRDFSHRFETFSCTWPFSSETPPTTDLFGPEGRGVRGEAPRDALRPGILGGRSHQKSKHRLKILGCSGDGGDITSSIIIIFINMRNRAILPPSLSPSFSVSLYVCPVCQFVCLSVRPSSCLSEEERETEREREREFVGCLHA